jgi:predicted TIM-barrel fold metal-dependent hydrolase
LSEAPYTVISADCHAGGSSQEYFALLDPVHHEAYERWRAGYSNPFSDLQGGVKTRNWDDERRVADLRADGIVAEVVFPNTIPPFFPSSALIARPPTDDDYELRLAGIRCHNRWLVDFCARRPGERRGVAQLFLNDVGEAVADVRFAADHGLAVLLPSVPDDTPLEPLYSPAYDPIWAACQEHDVVVNHHSGSGAPDYGPHPAAGMVFLAETTFWSRRALTHLLVGGVFERFPGLRLVITEQGASWIPAVLDQLDGFWRQARDTGRIGELKYLPEDLTPMAPSEYFHRNVWVAASFPSPAEAASRSLLGADRFLWGSDYPHHEATFPYTRESLRRSFAGADHDELRRVLGANTAAVYGFDLDALAPLAEEFGPTPEEIDVPLPTIPTDAWSPAFTRS